MTSLGIADNIFGLYWHLMRPVLSLIAVFLAFESALFAGDTVDHHQHLYSPAAGARSMPGPKGISAEELIAGMDSAGIRRAAVLSVAYSFGNPHAPAVADEYEKVRAENDWTSQQVARYPRRLVGFCSINPIKDYALKEIARCAQIRNLRTGLKLHFGNSDVDVNDPAQLERLRLVFRAANKNRMALVVHMRANQSQHRPYGAKEARVFVEQLLPEVPRIVVQIAHLAGGGGYDQVTEEALGVFVDAIKRGDPRTRNVYFDVSGIAAPGLWEARAQDIAARIREIGLDRMLYGSDAPVLHNSPGEARARWRQLPLTAGEFDAIEGNVAPYLKRK